jgi:hypothetical protein
LRHELLRGACNRARIRATRWLAMTVPVRAALARIYIGNTTDIRYPERYINPARHVRAFGV